jgi:hypothetical protein
MKLPDDDTQPSHPVFRDPREQLKEGTWDRAWKARLSRRIEDQVRDELRDSRAKTIKKGQKVSDE